MSADDAAERAVRLQQDSDWLKAFEENLEKNRLLSIEISTLLDAFQDRLVQLDQSVVPLHQKTAFLQRKQANIRKVLKTLDSMQQFYGRTAELESAIREGNASVDQEQFIDRMEQLAEAITFFSAQTTYQNQLEGLKMTFESGCCSLEKEFKNVLTADSVIADAHQIVECLNTDYEVINARLKEFVTLRNVGRCSRIACWLLAHNPNETILQTYANIRGANMMRTLQSISQQEGSSFPKSTVSLSTKSAVTLKQALRKATGRSSERYGPAQDWRVSDGTVGSILTSTGVLLALIEIETDVMSKVFGDVRHEAKVQQLMFGKPLATIFERALNLLDGLDCTLVPLLPLLKHINVHDNQLASLSSNAIGEIPYEIFVNKTRAKALRTLEDFLDRLSNDPSKFVPRDGNVHQVTSNTLNFLNSLMEYRQTVTNLLTSSGTKSNSATQFPRLFARTLSALGLNLKNKMEMFSDETLAAIFLLNNNNYIHNALQSHGMLAVVCEHNSQVRSFYQSEIDLYTKKYLQSWNRVVSIITVDLTTFEDKQTCKNALLAFTAELERLVTAQQEYCISDAKLANAIKMKIKDLIFGPFVNAFTRISQSSVLKGAEKYLKYTPESLEMVIDRLFDVAY